MVGIYEAQQHVAQCPGCGKLHAITEREFEMFGLDCWCIPCTDWKHVEFMWNTGRKLGLSCVKGCRCGFGK